jgi:hypothetical protein
VLRGCGAAYSCVDFFDMRSLVAGACDAPRCTLLNDLVPGRPRTEFTKVEWSSVASDCQKKAIGCTHRASNPANPAL